MALEKVNWKNEFPEYNPTSFTADKIRNRTGNYADPNL